MTDREKVIEGVKCCCNHIENMSCENCPYNEGDKNNCTSELAYDALALLKEQEAVKPEREEQTGRLWLCGNCGSYVGFEDHDEDDPKEFDKYCRKCGRPVLWEGR